MVTPASTSQPNTRSSYSLAVGRRLILYSLYETSPVSLFVIFRLQYAGIRSSGLRAFAANEVWATMPPSMRLLKSITCLATKSVRRAMLRMRKTRRFFLVAKRSITPGLKSGATTTSA